MLGRKVQVLHRIEIEGTVFYLKRNYRVATETLRRLVRFRGPTPGGLQECVNAEWLKKAGIPTLTFVAGGRRSGLIDEAESFSLSVEMTGWQRVDQMLRERLASSRGTQLWQLKAQWVRRVAEQARCLHGAGLNHQDYYLCHLFARETQPLALVDIQRVQKRDGVPDYYRVKDLAQLWFSADQTNVITRTDMLRFFRIYTGDRLNAAAKDLARRIVSRARRIAHHDRRKQTRRQQRGDVGVFHSE